MPLDSIVVDVYHVEQGVQCHIPIRHRKPSSGGNLHNVLPREGVGKERRRKRKEEEKGKKKKKERKKRNGKKGRKGGIEGKPMNNQHDYHGHQKQP